MFYIHPNILRKREIVFLHLIPTAIVFFAFLAVTLLVWSSAKNAIVSEQQTILKNSVQESGQQLVQRLATYETILRGGTNLFQINGDVSREQWREYVAAYDILTRYPGIQGVGYSVSLTPQERESHISSVRANDMPSYNLFPAGERDYYTSILYIEPFLGRNVQALGYDMFSEPVRRAAMINARDTGQTIVSNPVTLIQEGGEDQKQPGFLMYMPLYDAADDEPVTIDQRRTRLRGYVYAPFRAYDFVNNTTFNQDRNYSFKIEANNSELEPQELYKGMHYDGIEQEANSRSYTSDIVIPGTTWRLTGVVSESAVSEPLRMRPLGSLLSGAFVSIVIAGFIYLLIGNRSKALARKEERSIQEAKDELLALASHQLRTPATGVKQYIGMMREGFAGELSDMQKKLLEKAYESNERQLSTINEMLFVARADAGKLKMHKSEFDVIELLNDIIEEQRPSLETKQQSLSIQLPDGPIVCNGDKIYIRMALENLLSNAIKYTRPGGSIEVRLNLHEYAFAIQVQDNGVGVSDKDRRMLFKKFSRIPNDLTNQVSGSGIGLYLTKKVVDAHDGRIIFASKQTKGTTVTILLPRVINDQKSKSPGKNPPQSAPASEEA